MVFFTVEIDTQFVESDARDDCDEVACCHMKGGQRNTIGLGCSILGAYSQRQNGNSDNKVLAIALRYTAASIFERVTHSHRFVIP